MEHLVVLAEPQTAPCLGGGAPLELLEHLDRHERPLPALANEQPGALPLEPPELLPRPCGLHRERLQEIRLDPLAHEVRADALGGQRSPVPEPQLPPGGELLRAQASLRASPKTIRLGELLQDGERVLVLPAHPGGLRPCSALILLEISPGRAALLLLPLLRLGLAAFQEAAVRPLSLLGGRRCSFPFGSSTSSSVLNTAALPLSGRGRRE